MCEGGAHRGQRARVGPPRLCRIPKHGVGDRVEIVVAQLCPLGCVLELEQFGGQTRDNVAHAKLPEHRLRDHSVTSDDKGPEPLCHDGPSAHGAVHQDGGRVGELHLNGLAVAIAVELRAGSVVSRWSAACQDGLLTRSTIVPSASTEIEAIWPGVTGGTKCEITCVTRRVSIVSRA